MAKPKHLGPPYENRTAEAAAKMRRVSAAIHRGWYEGHYQCPNIPYVGPLLWGAGKALKGFIVTSFQLFREDWNA